MAQAGRWKGVVALLACVHCSLTFFVALGAFALGGAAAPTLLGVRADLVLMPLAGLALFTGWIWWGRRAAEACEVPPAGALDR